MVEWSGLQRENIVHSSRRWRARPRCRRQTMTNTHLGALALGASISGSGTKSRPCRAASLEICSRHDRSGYRKADPRCTRMHAFSGLCTKGPAPWCGLMPVEPDFRRWCCPWPRFLSPTIGDVSALHVRRSRSLARTALYAGPPPVRVVVALYNSGAGWKSDARAVYPTWALAVQPLLARDAFAPAVWGDCMSFCKKPAQRVSENTLDSPQQWSPTIGARPGPILSCWSC